MSAARRIVLAVAIAVCLAALPAHGCVDPAVNTGEDDMNISAPSSQTDQTDSLRLFVDDVALAVEWQQNDAVEALRRLAQVQPISIPMSMYGGFEQVGALGASLPRSDKQTTTQAGDIVLYAGNQIVLFYGSNSWAYTRLGRVVDKSAAELRSLLGQGDVVVKITYGG